MTTIIMVVVIATTIITIMVRNDLDPLTVERASEEAAE